MTGGGHAVAADEWRRHGLVLVPCVAGMVLLAVHAAVLGVMIPSLEKDFGWSRAQISAGFHIPSLGSLVLAPLIGSAVDRLGARPLALFGVPFYCLALGLLSLVGESIVAWWALYALRGRQWSAFFPTSGRPRFSRRFHRNRGMALAFALA